MRKSFVGIVSVKLLSIIVQVIQVREEDVPNGRLTFRWTEQAVRCLSLYLANHNAHMGLQERGVPVKLANDVYDAEYPERSKMMEKVENST